MRTSSCDYDLAAASSGFSLAASLFCADIIAQPQFDVCTSNREGCDVAHWSRASAAEQNGFPLRPLSLLSHPGTP